MITTDISSLLLLALASSVVAAQYPCTYTDSNGARYDLSRMYRSASEADYSLAVPENMEVFYVNVCGDTHAGCEADKHAGNCQLAADGNYYPCGDASKQTWEDYPEQGTEGVQLRYPDGQPCNGVPRTTSLNIKCDKSAPGSGVIDGIDGSVSCHYTISMSSKYACDGIAVDPPAPPRPELASFQSNVFVGSIMRGSAQPTAFSGISTIAYQHAHYMNWLLLNGTSFDFNKVGDQFGVLSIQSNAQVMKLPQSQCIFSVPSPPVNNVTSMLLQYRGPRPYVYTHFNNNALVKVDAWAGSVKGSRDQQPTSDDMKMVAFTDPDTGRLVWASGTLFFRDSYDDVSGISTMPFGEHAWFEFDPQSYKTSVSGEQFQIPNDWMC